MLIADLNSVETKACAKCREIKPVDDFYVSKRFKSGRRSECKQCEKVRALAWRAENPEKTRAAKQNWDEKNREYARQYSREYYYKNLEEVRGKGRLYQKQYVAQNAEKVKAKAAEYRERNREKLRQKAREYAAENAERNRIKARVWAEQNNARFRARVKAYAEAHPEMQQERVRARRKAISSAKVEWGNEFFISEIYDLARKRTVVTGHAWHVDHIVPIRSKIVCGLHVHWNLAVVPARANVKKSNKHWPDMP